MQEKEPEKKEQSEVRFVKEKENKEKRRYLRRMYERKKGLFSLSFWHIPFYWQNKKIIFFCSGLTKKFLSFFLFSSWFSDLKATVYCAIQKNYFQYLLSHFFGDGVGHSIKFHNVKVEKNPLDQNNIKIGQSVKSHELKNTYTTTHHLRVCYRHLVQWIGCISLLAT